MIKYLKALPRDKSDIWSLELKGYEYPLSHKSLEEVFDSPEVYPIVGKLGGTVVTWALTCVGKAHGEVELLRLTTHPAFRRKGFALGMVNHIVSEIMRGHGQGSITATVIEYMMDREDPDTVENFVWRAGFKAVGTSRGHFCHYGKDYDGIKLCREVT